jgi:hypothetical protein
MVAVLSGLKVATLVNVLKLKILRLVLSNALKLHAVMLVPILNVPNSDMSLLLPEKPVLAAILAVASVIQVLVINQLF